ncbi:hypothetical protein ACFU7Y_25810 [Kitasatospora sp. NPDC057542]|uniref:hypothetical protein n=1 Tax=Kitasatospora sp. NPDC057542 TaxID=3346162 RepID=UPI0036801E8F
MSTAMRASATLSLARRSAVAAALAITTLALNSCGASTLQERSKPTITLDQAKKQTDSYLADILAKLPVKPTASSGDFRDMECDANDIGPHGRTQTSRGYDFGDVPSATRAAAADAFRTLMTERGFQPEADPPNFHHDWIKLKNPTDNFLAVLDGVSDASRNVSLNVSSPCVWPNGTPPA